MIHDHVEMEDNVSTKEMEIIIVNAEMDILAEFVKKVSWKKQLKTSFIKQN